VTDRREQTLDPADWDEFRALGHRIIDDVTDYLRTVRERPAWQAPPLAVRTALDHPPPMDPMSAAAVYDDVRTHIMPYPLGNTHPRFWGWVSGSGAPIGVLADLVASAMNPNVAGYNQAASLVETQVIRWFVELLDLPDAASGLLLGSGSQANFVALAVARTAKAGFDVRAEGVVGGPPLTFYASTEVHQSAAKAVQTLGHGVHALRLVPVDRDYRVQVDALADAIAADRAHGCRPVCVIANAGTVNSGAIDPLPAIAALCSRENLWMHVDGAFGAVAALSPRLRPAVTGLERADSIAFDMHKWLYLPYDVAAVLVRDAEMHRAAFSSAPSYLAAMGRGVAPEPLQFAQRGVDLSRGFRALKVWMALKTYGVRGYATMLEQNVDQASYLASLIEAHPDLELLAPVSLNVVCFRYRAQTDDEQRLRALNEQILLELQERGIAVVSNTVIGGRFALRAAIVNHRSRREDFDLLTDAVVALGRELEA
jgi:aromatic-L-amino-acid/L-tryptophan decarboxylase